MWNKLKPDESVGVVLFIIGMIIQIVALLVLVFR